MELNIDETFRLFQYLVKDPVTDCWNWTGGKFTGGYGKLFFRGKTMKTHRIMFMVANKRPIKDGFFICHHCDNPSCCNPQHLFEGTAKDNRADQDKKLRHYHGEKVNTNKLTEDQVRQIRREFDEASKKFGMCSLLGRKYGVSNTQINLIVRGKSWKHLLANHP